MESETPSSNSAGTSAAATKKPAIPRPSGLPTLRKPSSATTSTSSSIENLRPMSKEKSNLSLSTSISQDPDRVLTSDTDSFIIGDTVWVGGSKRGRIAFIGETQFAKGEWAGVVLDEPSGKNDGMVSGVRYFQCDQLHGMFTKLTRLSRQPLIPIDPSKLCEVHGATPPRCLVERQRSPSPFGVTPTSPGMTTPAQYRVGSPTLSPGAALKLGDRVIVQSSTSGTKRGVLRYLGTTEFAEGEWAGIELDQPQGKNDGSVQGKRYFSCAPKFGLFAPVSKVSSSPANKRPPSSIRRFGSKESLASNLSSVMSSASRNVRSVRKLPPPPPSLGQTNSKCLPTCGLQSAMREMEIHLDQLMQEKEIDRQELVQLNKLLAQKSQQPAPIDQAAEALRAEVERYKEEVKVQKAANDALVARIDDLTRKLDDLQFSYEEEKIYHNDLQSQITGHESRDEEVTRLSSEVLERTVAQSKLDRELVSLKAELEKAQIAIVAHEDTTQKLQAAEAETVRLRAELSANADQIKQLTTAQSEVQTLRTELKEFKSKLEDSAAKEANFAEYRGKIEFEMKEMQISKEELEEELKSALEQLTAMSALKDSSLSEYEQKYKSQIDNLKVQLRKESSDSQLILLNVQESLRAELKAKESELVKMAERTAELEGQLKSSQTKIIEQTNQKEVEILEIITKTTEEKETIVAENAKLEEDCRAEMESIQLALEKAKSMTEELNAELTELRQSLIDHDSTTAKLKTEMEKLQAEKLEAETTLAKFRESAQGGLDEKSCLLEDANRSVQILKEKLAVAENEAKELGEKLTEKTTALEKTSSMIPELQSDLAKSKDVAAQLTEEKLRISKELEEKIAELDTTLKLGESTTDSSNARIKELESKQEELLSKHAEQVALSVKQMEKIQKEKADMFVKNEELSHLISNYEVTLEEMKKKLEESRAEIDSMQLAEEDLKSMTTGLNAELVQLRESLIDHNANTVKLESQMEKLNAEKLEVETTLAKFRESAQGGLDEKSCLLEDANRSLQRLKEKLTVAEDEAKDLAEKLTEQTTALEKTSSMIPELHSDLAKSKDAAAQLVQEKLRISKELEEKIAELETTLKLLESNAARSDAKVKELESKGEELVRKNAEQVTLSGKEMEKIQKEKADMVAKNEEMSHVISNYEAAVEELKKKLEEYRAEIDSMQLAEEGAKSMSAGLNAELVQLRERLIEHDANTVKLESQMQKFQAEKVELEAIIAKTLAEKEAIATENSKSQEDCRAEMESMKSALEKAKSMTDGLNAELTELRQSVIDHDSTSAKLKTELEKLQAEKLEVETTLAKFRESSQGGLDEKSCLLEDANRSVQILEEKLKLAGNEAKELAEKLTEKTTALEKTSSMIPELQSDLAKSKDVASQLAEEKLRISKEQEEKIVELETKLKRLESNTDGADAKIKELESQKEELVRKNAEQIVQFTQQMEKIQQEHVAELTKCDESSYSMYCDYEKMLDKMRDEFERSTEREREMQRAACTANEKLSQLELKFAEMQRRKDFLTKQLADAVQTREKLDSYDMASFLQRNVEGEVKQRAVLEAKLTKAMEAAGVPPSQLPHTYDDDFGKKLAEEGPCTPEERQKVNFLNSVINSLNRENEELKERLDILMGGGNPKRRVRYRNALDDIGLGSGSSGALLVGGIANSRLYCDICQEFDRHDTGDCPTQSNDAQEINSRHHARRGESRPYCTSCEVFGHSAEACDSETF